VTDDAGEDRAIARAFDRDDSGPAPDPAEVDAYREVTAYLADDVAPPPGLEDRVVAAALARRPAATTAIDAAPSARHRRRGALYAVLAGATAVAAAIVIALLVTSGSSPGREGRVETIAASRADVAAVAAQPGARHGTLSNGQGQVVIGTDGTGYLSELPSSQPVGVWVDTTSGTTKLGDASPQGGIIAFKVDHPDAVRAVRITSASGTELGRAELTTR
jgi:hypothetical protein